MILAQFLGAVFCLLFSFLSSGLTKDRILGGGQHVLRGEEVTLVRFKLILKYFIRVLHVYYFLKSAQKCWLRLKP